MEKFCNSCGNQLELNQRFCTQCKTTNPFFVPAFSLLSDQSESLEKLRQEKERIEKEFHEKAEAQKEFERQEQLRIELEELERQKAERLETERLIREKAERESKAEQQKELERQKILQQEIAKIEAEKTKHIEAEKAMREKAENERKEIEALEKQKVSRLESEKAMREKAEREQTEEAQKKRLRLEQLRKEIDALETQKAERIEKALRKDVQHEKNDTSLLLSEEKENERINLLRKAREEVREELNQIEEENKRLKQEVEALNKQIQATEQKLSLAVTPVTLPEQTEEQPEPAAVEVKEPQSSNGRLLKMVMGVVLLMGAFLVYFYFNNISSTQIAAITEIKKTTSNLSTTPVQQIVDTVLEGDAPTEKKVTVDDAPVKIKNAVLTTTTKPAEAKKTTAIIPPVEKPNANQLITETKVMTDLNGKRISGCGVVIGNEVDLEKVSNLVRVEKTDHYTKYKCNIKLKHGSETYTAVPYLYYTEDGAIIKVDGTNCE